jgi:membrane protease YdiL (CAAX protease family)
MQTYLKSRPAWVQLLLFLGIASASAIIILGFGGLILTVFTGSPLNQMGGPKAGATVPDNLVFNIRVLNALQFIGLFILPSIVFAKMSDSKPAQYLGLRMPNRNIFWLLAIAVMLVSIPFVEYTGLLNRQIVFPASLAEKIRFMEESATRTIMQLLQRHSIGNLLINVITIAVFAGVGEEIFFRGIIQRILIRATRSPIAGILLTAALFSFFHFQFYGFVPRLILGALLGAAYWYSGSLWVAILAHTFFDALQLIIVWFHPEMAASDAMINTSAHTLLPAAIISAIVTGAVLWLMKRNSDARMDDVFKDELQPADPTNKLTFDDGI